MTATTISSITPLSIRKQVRLLPKVQTFLKSVSRNSESSAAVYEAGIIYFYSFLIQGLNHSVETILDPLGRSEINVYELFDGFVAFLMSSGLSSYLSGH